MSAYASVISSLESNRPLLQRSTLQEAYIPLSSLGSVPPMSYYEPQQGVPGYVAAPMPPHPPGPAPPYPPPSGFVQQQPGAYNVGFGGQPMGGAPQYTTQPGAPIGGGAWMTKPAAPPGYDCPPSLEYLGAVDHIRVKQKLELAEIVLGWETKNRYVLYNSAGQQVYYAFEETSCCNRQCCGAARGFVIHIVDNFNQEVMRIERPFKCFAGCCWCAAPGSCCSHEATVEAPPGKMIAIVRQCVDGCANSYVVEDADGKQLLDIPGPCCCAMMTCSDKVFPVHSLDGVEVGEIRKQWAGCLRESFTDADNFGVNFPMNMPVKEKAALIGATFLIDFMNFESQQQ